MLRNLKLYFHFTTQNIRGLLEYKNDFIISTLAGAVWQAVGLVFLFALFSNIHSVGGWTLYEVALLYALVMFSEGVITFGFQGASTGIGRRVHNGELDRFLVRPVNLMTQFMGAQTNFAGVCTTVISVVLLVVSLQKLQISITIGRIIVLIVNLIFGIWIRLNIDVMANCIAFFTNGGGVVSIIHSTQNFGKYPITIFPKPVRFLLFSVLPHGLISYVPACLLLRRLPIFPYLLAIPFSAVLMTYIRKYVFSRVLSRYESAGN